MLWICLRFPALPVDRQVLPGPCLSHAAQSHAAQPPIDHASSDQSPSGQPVAVIELKGSHKEIMACNAVARARGIHAGQALKNAYALVPNLLISEYDAEEQQAHLEQLALSAMQYSSWVTPRMPNTVLLEVQASLKLFGGLSALLEKLHSDAEAQGLTMQSGIAPTPSAAALFAHAGQTMPVRSLAALTEALASIPIEYLAIDSFTHKGLRQSGIRNLGQLQAIPKASLTRRFGHQCTELLYKLDGSLPDPCPAFTPPNTFRQAFDLPLEVPDTQALAFPLNRLSNALGHFLKSSDLGVKQLDIRLYHHRHPPTVVTLSFLDATANHTHMYKVAVERLASTRLPAPVMRLAIKARELSTIVRNGKDLFQKSQAQASSIQQVLDNLMARLGKDCLYTAMPGDDHRPEKAWLATLLETRQLPTVWPARPLWLLKTPHAASELLEITSFPERIENGWWDDTDVRRDYYIARNRMGAHFWVYKLRHDPQQIYIHGLFA
jgi:protein ImuB